MYNKLQEGPVPGGTIWNRFSFWYLILVLFGLMSVEYLRSVGIRSEFFSVLRTDLTRSVVDPGNQAILVGLLAAAHVGLCGIKLRANFAAAHGTAPGLARLGLADFSRSGLVVLSLAGYFWNTPPGSNQPVIARLLLGSDQSTNILVLLTGIILSQALGLFLNQGMSQDIRRALTALLGFLCLSFILQAEGPHVYRYGDIIRKSGLWVNPNTHGLLMALGLVITLGLILSRFGSADHGTRRHAPAVTVMLAITLLLLGWQLLHSFSRGAWLAAGLGTATLLWHFCAPAQSGENIRLLQLRRVMLPLGVIMASLLVTGFWFLRDAPHGAVRRLYSINNPNDFSIRNRITAWSGALEMIQDRPWTGYGWGSAETVYENYYMPLALDDGKAIGLNDYATLGITLGLTGLGLFSLLLIAHWRKTRRHPGPIPWTCNAGLLTLLVGFVFEGGLFKLATAAPFWILFELGTLHAPRKE